MKSVTERGILSRYDTRRKANWIGFFLVLCVIILMVFTMLYPILFTFFNSFKGLVEINSFPPHLLPQDWHWENFREGWQYLNLPHFLGNTLAIFAGNMVATMFVLGLASFSMSRLSYPYRKAVYFFFLLTLFIPPSTYIVPNFVNLKDLGLLNTFWAFWLPAGASAFYLLLLKSFFDSLHLELFEAARIDGASEWRSFLQIALPLSAPIMSTLAIFVFASAWNDWFWPSLVMHGDPKYPLATAIYKKVVSGSVTGLKLNVKFAILSMVMLPPIAVFLIFQRFIIRGLHLGGVKG
ncbi:carbohydrate ABC transporter permease [Paenibacillus sp. GP183]|jgi:multiple sugar transport system permease protein|uniref:carbohydrate ABC transporter permease n=1 Tax=Paenibacillus sp. GP183 TaxID=1882751 RepID=UPI000895267B|nr:carbohydrate ABC transporter permease [Paenibacillus sp. GP183]SEC03716.1 carbohydrate ABC transporter membrane protein 2, CUT1 family [Paenibacillus sp. GP183]